MTDQTAEAVERLRLVIGGLRSDAERARKTAKRSKRDKLLWECRADMFDKDAAALSTLLADRERLRLALKPFAALVPSSFFMADGSEGETYRMYLADDKGPYDLCAGDLAEARAALNTQGEG